MPSIKVGVTGLNCDHCEKKLEHALRKVPEVSQAKADYKSKEVVIQFDQSKPNQDDLHKAFNELGYQMV